MGSASIARAHRNTVDAAQRAQNLRDLDAQLALGTDTCERVLSIGSAEPIDAGRLTYIESLKRLQCYRQHTSLPLDTGTVDESGC